MDPKDRSLATPAVRAVGVLCALGLVAGITAACGSSASGGSNASGASTGSGAKTIEVGATQPVTGPVPSPEEAPSIEAYFKQVNAAGGVNGYQLKFTFCDNQLDPTKAANCLKSLAGNKNILAFVGNHDAITVSNYKIADIGPEMNAPEEASSPDSFPLSSFAAAGAGDARASLGYVQKKGVSVKPGAIACPSAGCVSSLASFKALFPTGNVTLAPAPITAVSLGPQITSLQHSGANLIDVVEGTTGIVGAIQAASQANYHPYFALSWSCFDQQVLTALPSSTPNTLCPSPYNLGSSAVAEYKQTMNKDYGSKWTYSIYGLNAWFAAQVFVDALKQVKGPITRQSILSAMKTLTFSSDALAKPIDFGSPAPVAKYPSVHNWYWFPYSIDGKKMTPAGSAIDVSNISGS